MGEISIALGSSKASHVALARVNNLYLICEVNALCEERPAILSYRPYANPVGEDDALTSSGGRGNPLRLGRFDGRTRVGGRFNAPVAETI